MNANGALSLLTPLCGYIFTLNLDFHRSLPWRPHRRGNRGAGYRHGASFAGCPISRARTI